MILGFTLCKNQYAEFNIERELRVIEYFKAAKPVGQSKENFRLLHQTIENYCWILLN